MKFDNYSGPIFFNTDLVPISPVSLASCTVETCERHWNMWTQVPLNLSCVATIKKFQQLAIQITIIDLGPAEKVAGLACVALWRIKDLWYFLVETTSFD